MILRNLGRAVGGDEFIQVRPGKATDRDHIVDRKNLVGEQVLVQFRIRHSLHGTGAVKDQIADQLPRIIGSQIPHKLPIQIRPGGDIAEAGLREVLSLRRSILI